MTDAIEAGARAIIKCRRESPHGWASSTELSQACIEAAIASGALVPASAVAEMKGDLDAMSSAYAEISVLVGRRGTEEHSLADDVREKIASAVVKIKNRIDSHLNAALCEMKPNHDDSISGFNDAWDIVRKVFDLAPASGEYVVVPREPTKEMVNAGCKARVDGWDDSYYDDEERQEIVEWVKEGYRAMLHAASSNGGEK